MIYDQAIHLLQQNKPQEALPILRGLLGAHPYDPALRVNLAICHEDLQQLPEAEESYKYALTLDHNHIEALGNYANLLVRTNRIDQGAQLQQQIVSQHPDDPYALQAYAYTLIEQLDVDSAVPLFQRAAEITDSPADFSLYLTYSQSLGYDGEAHQKFIDRFCPARAWAPDLIWDGDRPLRVGFIGDNSSFNRESSVGRFLTPLISHLSSLSNIIQVSSYHLEWYANNSDSELYRILVNEHLDVIVDLMGHRLGNRILVLAQNPAPIIWGYLGYPGDTKITENIDRLVGWVWECPEGKAPPPSLSPMPCLPGLGSHGRTPGAPWTFGVVCSASHISAVFKKTVSEILGRVPGSRLLVLCRAGEDNRGARDHFNSYLTAEGIDNSRLELVDRPVIRAEFLKLANRIDLVLDGFPFSSGATLVDFLWMGVPSITLDDISRDHNKYTNQGLPILFHSMGRHLKAAAWGLETNSEAKIRGDLFSGGDSVGYIRAAVAAASAGPTGLRDYMIKMRSGLRKAIEFGRLSDFGAGAERFRSLVVGEARARARARASGVGAG